jgi:hypothetical protein
VGGRHIGGLPALAAWRPDHLKLRNILANASEERSSDLRRGLSFVLGGLSIAHAGQPGWSVIA